MKPNIIVSMVLCYKDFKKISFNCRNCFSYYNTNLVYDTATGFSSPTRYVNVSCISEEYYNLNNPIYRYQTNVYLPEMVCECIKSKCQIVPIGILPTT
jgi:hypothetical protein